MEDVIPPTLSEMRQDMLPRQFENFIHYRPHVEENRVSYDETSQEPVTKMNGVIVVEIIPQILQRDFTIIIVSMMAFQNWCV